MVFIIRFDNKEGKKYMTNLVVVTKKWGRNFTGATSATQYFIEKWHNIFNSIHIFTLEEGEYAKLDNVKVKKLLNTKELLKEIAEYKKNNLNAQILGYSDDHLGYILKKMDIKYVHTYHGNWPDARWINFDFFLKSFYFMHLYKKTIKNAEFVINVSQYMDNFTKKFNAKSYVINNGIDFKYNTENILEHKKKTFLMVGNIDSRKYKKAIKLSKIIYRKDTDIKIDIYGDIIKTKIANKLSKQKNIELKGKQTQIPYKSYCGLINTSTIENLSISVCEALMCNIPVFCFSVGGLPEVVKNDETGYCYAVKDIDLLADKIVKCSNDELKFKLNCNKNMEKFNWDYAAKKYIDVFEQLIK